MTLDRLDASPPLAEPDDLELRFGDPRVPGPFDYASIVADDEARRTNQAAEALLDEWGAAADLVPADLGGRWASTEALVHRWRPVFRRDPALGMGHLSTFDAALHVWAAGDDLQRTGLAARLLRGERIAAPLVEPPAGGDAADRGCVADLYGDRWLVRGRRLVVDPDRATSMLIVARTGPASDPHGHSLLLWHADAATAQLVDTSERAATGGLRARRVGLARFDQLSVPVDGTVGRRGTAAGTMRTVDRVRRAVLPAFAVATVDASIELAVDYASERSLYGGSVLDLPQSRALLAGAIADLLVADAFAAVAVRALHVTPEACGFVTAASWFAVPQLLSAAMQDLSVLFGSTFYARVAPYDVFEKFHRDVAALWVRGTGSADPLATMPAEPWAARPSRGDPVDPALFRLGEAVDALDFERLSAGAAGVDPLGGALRDPGVLAAFASVSPALGALERISDAIDGLRLELARVATAPDEPDASSDGIHSARRLAFALAAAAFAGVCAEAGELSITADPLVREACLRRIEERLAGRVGPLEPHLVERLVAIAEDRARRGIRLTLTTTDRAMPRGAQEGDLP